MRRRVFLAAVFGVATIGASPHRSAPPVLSPDENFPLPPMPPATPPAFQAAPMPDLDLSAPAQARAQQRPAAQPRSLQPAGL